MPDPSVKLAFWCAPCACLFDDEHGNPPSSLDDTRACPDCGRTCEAVIEEQWMPGLHAMRRAPWTEERRRKAAKSGATGPHPGPITQQGKARSCGNAYKHGAYAQRFLIPIARAGRYASCQQCPYAPGEVNAEGNNECDDQKFVHCAFNLEKYARVLNAHLSKNPEALRAIMVGIQARGLIGLDDALHKLVMEGPFVEERFTKIVERKDGGKETTEGVKYVENPAIHVIRELAKLGGASLPEWELTPKSKSETESENKTAEALASLYLPRPKAAPDDPPEG